MTKFTEEDLSKLTKLCRIECPDNEKKEIFEKLNKILSYIEQLQEIDTEGVSECNHILECVDSVAREDQVGEILSQELFLANAPSHVGGMIRVPPIIKFNNS